MLLRAKADPNLARKEDSLSRMHTAAYGGNTEIGKILAVYGGDVVPVSLDVPKPAAIAKYKYDEFAEWARVVEANRMLPFAIAVSGGLFNDAKHVRILTHWTALGSFHFISYSFFDLMFFLPPYFDELTPNLTPKSPSVKFLRSR